LSAESYLVLALWCIVGFAFYRQVFKHDAQQRFGRSPVVWSGIVILVFFSSLMWVRLSTQSATSQAVDSIVAFQARHCAEVHGTSDVETIHHEQDYVTGEMESLDAKRRVYDIVQLALFACSLVIIFNLYLIQRRRQEELEMSQAEAEARDRAKSAFLSSISHDIRTPMNAIIGYIELARRAGGDIGKVREYVGKLEASSHHLLALINDVLEMSRIESGRVELEPVPIDICAVLDETADVFAAQMTEKSIEFSIDRSGVAHPFVMCDRSRLNRILLNIVGNAWKFTPAGGSITVTLRETAGGVYELRVKDTGIGMSDDFVKRVFDPFERERTSVLNGVEGTGLGMPITKGIVTLMGGSIDLRTELGKGTEFIVRLPLEQVDEKGVKSGGVESGGVGSGGVGGEIWSGYGGRFIYLKGYRDGTDEVRVGLLKDAIAKLVGMDEQERMHDL
jgi:signal transduction histidine kinase